MMKADIIRGHEDTDKFGKISRIQMLNKSRIYISKIGWNLTHPKNKEINIPWEEVFLAINESIIQGYIKNDILIPTKVGSFHSQEER